MCGHADRPTDTYHEALYNVFSRNARHGNHGSCARRARWTRSRRNLSRRRCQDAVAQGRGEVLSEVAQD